MKTYREWRYSSAILTSELDVGEWLASRPGRSTPEESAFWCSLNRSVGGPQNPSGRYRENTNFTPAENPTPVVQLVAIPTELTRLFS
jgi:hypothetical protein